METTSPLFLSEELKMLRQEKGKTCISIIIPFQNLFPGQKTGKQHLDKAIEALSDQLKSNYPTEADALIESVADLYKQIDLEHEEGGLGLFVSENVSHYTWFPFSVIEKILIGNSFELRDLLYKQQYSIPYYVLYFDKNAARLYSGNQKQLQELKNKAFPLQYNDEYAYETAPVSSSYHRDPRVKRFERSQVQTERFESFFHEADELLSLYIEGAKALILCGSKFYTSAFVNRCSCAEKIISIINGNYEWFKKKDLINIVWPAVEVFTHDKMMDEITGFEDKVREGLAEEGIAQVWKAVAENRGVTLLIEKDFHIHGFLETKYTGQFYVHRPKYPSVVIPNAINELVEMALDKNNKVVFVENGLLKNHQNIALITSF